FGECRFGFLQALRESSENTAAKQGLESAIALMVEYEVARKNPKAAAVLLGELTAPRPELAARVRVLAWGLSGGTAELSLERAIAIAAAFFASVVVAVGLVWRSVLKNA